jgi:arabinogalactan endo-1,4-beta-galactosidase
MMAGVVLCTSVAGAEFFKGVDLSILKAAEDGGVQYRIAGQVQDPVIIFKENGCNYVRLRLFVNPSGKDGQVNTLAYTLQMAKRVKQAGLPLLLDLQYCDGWADAKSQAMPAAWKGLTNQQLLRAVRQYTLDTLKAFQNEGCLPDMVAVGNEITNGYLWPVGGPMSNEKLWPSFIELLKTCIAAVREVAPASRTKVMVHVDRGDNALISEWFFSHLQRANVEYDVIGLSYYPYGPGSLDNLRQNLAALSRKYDKDIIIVETSYWYCGEQGDLPFPTSADGQKAFLDRVMDIVAQTPGGHGKGVFYWEPAWIQGNKWNGPAWSNIWECRALFDAQGNALPALSCYWRPDPAMSYPSVPDFSYRTAADAVTAVPRRSGVWWKRHQDLLKLVAQHRDSQLIFIGDSITDMWQYEPSFGADFGKYDALDLGISGDTTEYVLFRLENGEIDGLHPKLAVLLIGTNNAGVGDRPEWIAAGVKKIVDELHRKLPGTRILLLGIFPRDLKDSKLRAVVAATNPLVAKFAEPNTTYLDIGGVFLDSNGEIPPEVMKDLLHPTTKGYELWFKAMRPELDKLMQ